MAHALEMSISDSLPSSMAFAKPDNAVVRILWALVLGAIGLVWIGSDSLGALLLNVPLLYLLVTIQIHLLKQIPASLRVSPHTLSIKTVALGPVVIRTRPSSVASSLGQQGVSGA